MNDERHILGFSQRDMTQFFSCLPDQIIHLVVCLKGADLSVYTLSFLGESPLSTS
jgi:hypothetical protein